VHPVFGCEREELHHVGGSSAAPGVPGDRDALDRDREPAEELDRHCSRHDGMVGTHPDFGQAAPRNGRGTVVLLAWAVERR
jgi:hypothetical protein